jgi:hypothetical protein
VALQGSIDTFALDDVLRLVASTAKTGRLTLHGSRGSGELLVRDGQILDGTVTTDEHVGDLTELVFELLRFEDGEFEFDATTIDGYEGAESAEVEGLIGSASELLAEWREIENVVPWRGASVKLAPEGPGGTVKVEAAQWRMIAAVGGGARVEELSERLDASHLATGRLLHSLIRSGLVAVAEDEEAVAVPEAPAPVDMAEVPATTDYVPFTPEPATWADEPAPWPDGPAQVNGNGSNGNGTSDNGHTTVIDDLLLDSVHEPATVAVADHAEVEAPVVDAAEFARRLAELPPRAAKAVAAAARATSVEEREAALAELDGTGEEVDHEVLLQLLGPVEG